jgi:hypothetical protein
MVIAEQTQFAVGQGGLHLCQILKADADRRDVVSIVFDCGGKSTRLDSDLLP